MKLSEIFSQLTFGELSQLALGGGEDGEIPESKYEQVLFHVNLGLTDLYKRFPLKEGRITVQLQPGRITYPLTSAYAVSTRRSKEPVRYILDSEDDPFQDDIFKVERVLTDKQYELGLNDEADLMACMTPSATVLRVPRPIVEQGNDLPNHLKTSKLEVVYRANHPKIVKPMGYFDPSRVEVELPYSHLEALLYFIASRVHNPTGMVNEFHMGNSYAAKYEMACEQLETLNLRVDQGGHNTRLRDKGWV